MPYYRVLLEADGIEVPDLSNGPPVVGFCTTRIVRSDSVSGAEQKAKAMVLADWTTGEYAALNLGARPELKVDSVYGSNWWEHLWFKNKGHVFFAAGENAEQSVAADGREGAAPAER